MDGGLEMADSTIDGYLGHLRAFMGFLNGREITKEPTAGRKVQPMGSGYAAPTMDTNKKQHNLIEVNHKS